MCTEHGSEENQRLFFISWTVNTVILFTLYPELGESPVRCDVPTCWERVGESSLDLSSITTIVPTTATAATATNRNVMDAMRKASRQPLRRRPLFWRDSTSISVLWCPKGASPPSSCQSANASWWCCTAPGVWPPRDIVLLLSHSLVRGFSRMSRLWGPWWPFIPYYELSFRQGGKTRKSWISLSPPHTRPPPSLRVHEVRKRDFPRRCLLLRKCAPRKQRVRVENERERRRRAASILASFRDSVCQTILPTTRLARVAQWR